MELYLLLTLCHISTQACEDRVVGINEIPSMSSCLTAWSAVSAYMDDKPTFRVKGWKCVLGRRSVT